MPALTYEVDDPHSPVAVWLRTTFPHHRQIQADYRTTAGVALVLPPDTVALQTQGAAIDWWIRFLVDPAPTLDLALLGLGRIRRLPCFRAGMRLLYALGGIDRAANLLPVDPTRFADRDDVWWARVCYSLALLVEPLRAYTIEGSRLMRLRPGCDVPDLLALANADEVVDLIRMRDLALTNLLPALPAGPVATAPTFDGSADLNADADLVAGGMLVDIKAGRGGKPRKDGTRAASLGRDTLDQLIGYALMDYTDHYRLHSVAVYATRFGHLAAWPLEQLLTQLAGAPVSVAALTRQFRNVLSVELPQYWQTRAQPSGGHRGAP